MIDTTLTEQQKPEEGLFDGIDTTIMGMAKVANTSALDAEFAQLQESVDAAVRNYDARHPWTVVPHLASGLKTTRGLIENLQRIDLEDNTRSHLLFLLQNKENEFMTAAHAALGVSLEVLVQPATETRSSETFNVAIPGQKFSIGMRMVNPAPVAAELVNASLHTPDGWNVHRSEKDADREERIPIQTNEPISLGFEVEVAQNADYTQPYWTRASEYHDAVLYTDASRGPAIFPSHPPKSMAL